MKNIYKLSAVEINKMFLEGKITAEEIVNETFDRINKVDSKIKGFVNLRKEKALEAAKQIDMKYKNGEKLGKLAGIPISIKDNMLSKGDLSTSSSKMLQGYRGIYDATAIERLKKEDAIIIGTTNMDEFAMGSTTKTSYYYMTTNPWDIERVPGGSSGGAAAVIASEQVFLSLGSDTGGSIRQPSAFCGVVGLKPTYGRVSRYGLMSFASSLDQIGPIGKNVEDLALCMNTIAGYDENDSTTADVEVPNYFDYLNKDIKGMKIGIPAEYFVEGINPDLLNIIENSIEKLKSLGAEIVPISLPHTKYLLATYYVLAPAEASSNLSRYDGIRYGYKAKEYGSFDDMYKMTRTEGFGDEVKLRIMIGTYVLSQNYYEAYFKKSQKVRALIKKDFTDAFNTVDVILTPTTPNIAFKLKEQKSNAELHLEDIFTISANLAGIPAISVPAGLSNNMPVGIQLLAKEFQEGDLFKVASAFENIRGKFELPNME